MECAASELSKMYALLDNAMAAGSGFNDRTCPCSTFSRRIPFEIPPRDDPRNFLWLCSNSARLMTKSSVPVSQSYNILAKRIMIYAPCDI